MPDSGTDFSGSLAVVTGAGSGIGRATAHRLAAHGANIAAVDLDLGAAKETCALIAAKEGAARAYGCDVTDPVSVDGLVEAVQVDQGWPDVLINVVGGARVANVEEMAPDFWDEQVAFNLTSVFLMCHAFLPGMLERGSGAIVNTSSGYGFMPAPGRSAYAACKAGIVSFSRSLATEVGPQGVRVNVVSPGPIATERMLEITKDDAFSKQKHAQIPLRRLGTPDEVAAAMLFLVSGESAFVTGQVIHVNGGVFMP